jgi:hypothetical protein
MNDLLRALIQDVVDSASMDGRFTACVDKEAIGKLADYLAMNPPGPKEPIVVILTEGEVTDVHIPYEGYSVEVRDYDTVANWEEYADPDDSQPLQDWTEVDEDGGCYASRMFIA